MMLQPTSLALRNLHKALLDFQAAAIRFTGTPMQLYDLVAEDIDFIWLKPIMAIIVEMDERSASDDTIGAQELTVFHRRVTALIQDPEFRKLIRPVLQSSPDAVVALGALRVTLIAQN
jgi:hypothetical protein